MLFQSTKGGTCFPKACCSPNNNDLIEVWFPGVHRDVGGGYSAEDGQIAPSGLPDVTLRWIVAECKKAAANGPMGDRMFADLGLQPAECKFGFAGPDPYVAAGLYPMKMWDGVFEDFRTLWPNFKHTRFIPGNSLVHCSVRNWIAPLNTSVEEVLVKGPETKLALESVKNMITGSMLSIGQGETGMHSVVLEWDVTGPGDKGTVTLADEVSASKGDRVSREAYEPINLPEKPVYYDPDNPVAAQPSYYSAQILRWTLADALGIIFGLCLVSALILRLPAGAAAHAFWQTTLLNLEWPGMTQSWKAGWDWVFAGGCAVFILAQAYSGSLNEPDFRGIFPAEVRCDPAVCARCAVRSDPAPNRGLD